MKKLFALILSISILAAIIPAQAKLGDIEGYTKYTDIVAYINHFAVESYNVNGKTCVIAEDLANYGFAVSWDGDTRSLYITRDEGNNKINQYSVPYETDPSMIGKDALPILSTDIKTFVNGVEAYSYNIDGKTVVDFESLSAFGPVVWDNGLRVIKLWVEDGLEMRYFMQELNPLPKTTLYSADGRTISVFPSEVDAYVKVGWYKSKDEAKSIGDAAKNKKALANFKVGQDVMDFKLIWNKYGTVKNIDYNTGKLNVYWYRIEDSNGVAFSATQGMLMGLYSTTWVNASEVTPLY